MTDATRRTYGRWARVYDVLASGPLLRTWRRAAVDALELGATETVVEMGSGTGANLPFLRARVGNDGTVVGVDLTRAMLERARGRGDAMVCQGDATRPPVRGAVDGLLATFLVAMFSDPVSVVDTWVDHVRPGGRIALLHFSRSDRWWATPLAWAYRSFVRVASAEGIGDADAAATHDARVQVAHDALEARTVEYRERRLAGGFLRLASGRVPEE